MIAGRDTRNVRIGHLIMYTLCLPIFDVNATELCQPIAFGYPVNRCDR